MSQSKLEQIGKIGNHSYSSYRKELKKRAKRDRRRSEKRFLEDALTKNRYKDYLL